MISFDPVARTALETIHAAGFPVTARRNCVTAVDDKTDEIYLIRFDDPVRNGDVLVRLAEQVGIDLEDG